MGLQRFLVSVSVWQRRFPPQEYMETADYACGAMLKPIFCSQESMSSKDSTIQSGTRIAQKPGNSARTTTTQPRLIEIFTLKKHTTKSHIQPAKHRVDKSLIYLNHKIHKPLRKQHEKPKKQQ